MSLAGRTIVASGLRFPEGPIAMEDGSVLLVEIQGQTLVRVQPDGGKHVIAELKGGPNGAAIGPDGRCYRNCGDIQLRGPNDLVFDRDGGIWFTDSGKVMARQRDRGAVFYARIDGSFISVDRTVPSGLGIKKEPRFNTITRNRVSVAVDLKSPAGREVALRLIEKADALIEGHRPGVMERLGLGPEPCWERGRSLTRR